MAGKVLWEVLKDGAYVCIVLFLFGIFLLVCV